MISIIVCSENRERLYQHRGNVKKTCGAEYEYITVTPQGKGICFAYNEGIKEASGEILLFVHDDAYFMVDNWGATLHQKFQDDSIGLIGVAGTEYLFKEFPLWSLAGVPFVHGKVLHSEPDGSNPFLTIFSDEEEDHEVVAVDGVCFAVRASLFEEGVRFDEENFDAFHFYDLDISMQVIEKKKGLVTSDIIIKHLSRGNFGEIWKKYSAIFQQKYRKKLPASCTTQIPTMSSENLKFQEIPMGGRISKEIPFMEP